VAWLVSEEVVGDVTGDRGCEERKASMRVGILEFTKYA
jgi:hypothetical protein